MILTAMGVSMVVPEFIPQEDWRLYSAFTIGAMLLLYGVFLRMQVGAHSYFFSYSYPEKKRRRNEHPATTQASGSAGPSIAMLCVGVVIIGALAEVMSQTMK